MANSSSTHRRPSSRSKTSFALSLVVLLLSTSAVFHTSAQVAQDPQLTTAAAPAAAAVEDSGSDNPVNTQQTITMKQIFDPHTFGNGEPDESYKINDDSPSLREALADLSGAQSQRPSSSIDDDIRQLVESLTLEELVGQLTQIQIGMLLSADGRLDPDKVKHWIVDMKVGSFLDTPTNHGGEYLAYSANQFALVVDELQKVAGSTRKKIPIIYGLDSVHGANYVDGATMFPQQIGLAATFNTTFAYEAGRIAAKDTRAAGIPWVFAPILDVAIHKLWPRVYESFGEDPFLVAQMGSALIKGLQGNYKKDRSRVAACMKHFIGYSASRNGQDKSSAWIPDNYLMDYFVPPFQAAVDAGVATAMNTYIDVNGQPVVSSRFYLKELLRHRLGFEGMLVTDWAEVDRLYTEHRSATSLKDAAYQCLNRTTVDMVMVPESESFSTDTLKLVQEGQLDKERIIDSAAKVLQLKKDLGLFENPMSDPDLLSLVGSKQDIEAAKAAARESITLLKNDGSTLPLIKKFQQQHQKETEQHGSHRPGKVVLTGPAADSTRALSGGWSIKWQGAEVDDWYQNRHDTIYESLKSELSDRSVSYVASVDFDGISNGSDQYLEEAKDAETVILCMGEKPYAEILGNQDELYLAPGQLNVIAKVAEQAKRTNTKVVLVLVEGRPRGLEDLAEMVDAIVMAYLPGPWGGLPIAEVLSGKVNPSGRLPMTYPRGTSDMATTYYRSGVDPYKPLFPFGAGLSYTTVEYHNLQLNTHRLHTKTYDDSSSQDEDHENDDNDYAEETDHAEDNKNAEGDDDRDGDGNDDEDEDEDDNDREDEDRDEDDDPEDGKDMASIQKRRSRKRSKVAAHSKIKAPRSDHIKVTIWDKEDKRFGKQIEALEKQAAFSSSNIPSKIIATVTVENTGDYPVKEVVFWYITQDYRSEVMPEAYLLKGFEKISLDEGERKEVQFTITRDALAFHGRNLKRKVEKGMFTLTVNAMRPEAQSVKFSVI
ncbi:hypothetical protein BGZ70_009517 [Mortierella alpina]|uniref:beta-glucosidase n=1 Tax=Mortierella alpina TaxID=64518 RepID=A0A9P6J1A3_MORAP|nr:hypothetical protein BGZ70_009517 [Mortierella alpina]